MKHLTLLGSTGSIGCSTLDVVRHNPELYTVTALVAGKNVQRMVEQCLEFAPRYAVMDDEESARLLKAQLLEKGSRTEVLSGQQAACEMAALDEVDQVMAAIVGAAGLLPTLAAVKAGKRVLLANKEALVMSGDIMMRAAEQHQALLLPVDSEHNAIFQCLPNGYCQSERTGQPKQGVSRILLTASGGPFLNTSLEQLQTVTPAQACKHPNWSMGQKISVDSATLMNKGLELIEACHLFSILEHFVTVVIHPQSIIHSMVQYVDGSTLAQMGNPDMCTPIAHALAWPNRISTSVDALDVFTHQQLNFQQPDTVKFPALSLARYAMQTGGTAPAILNAANEIAVAAFLQEKIKFTAIPEIVEHTLNTVENMPANSLETILQADQFARNIATQRVDALRLK